MKIETQKTRKKYDRYSIIYDLVKLPMELLLRKRRKELIGNLEGENWFCSRHCQDEFDKSKTVHEKKGRLLSLN